MQTLVYKPSELIDVLKLSRSMIYQLLRSGQLASIRVGKCIRVTSSQLEAFLKQQESAA